MPVRQVVTQRADVFASIRPGVGAVSFDAAVTEITDVLLSVGPGIGAKAARLVVAERARIPAPVAPRIGTFGPEIVPELASINVAVGQRVGAAAVRQAVAEGADIFAAVRPDVGSLAAAQAVFVNADIVLDCRRDDRRRRGNGAAAKDQQHEGDDNPVQGNARTTFSSSDRSVAGAGVRLRSAISVRNSGVILTSTDARESFNCSTLRAPMIGAVTAGCVPTQAIAVLTGCRPFFLQKAVYFSATSNIHGSP